MININEKELKPLFDDNDKNNTLRNSLSVDNSAMLVIRSAKVIGKIVVCGGLQIEITDIMSFSKPTPEQIKNLHDFFNIDVILYDEERNDDNNE